MIEYAAQLRALLGVMSAEYPHAANEALRVLEAILTEHRVSGLEDAMAHFTKKQKDLDQRRIGKGLTPEQRADMKTDAGRAGWAAQELRLEMGRRKKGTKG